MFKCTHKYIQASRFERTHKYVCICQSKYVFTPDDNSTLLHVLKFVLKKKSLCAQVSTLWHYGKKVPDENCAPQTYIM